MSEATSGISLLSALTKSEQAAIRAAALPGCDAIRGSARSTL